MKRLRLTQLVLLLAFALLALPSKGQVQTQRYWFFGNGINGLRFDAPSNVPALVNRGAVVYGTGGGAVATDATNGTLLFYTDGSRVYDINHTVMPNGTGLSGNNGANAPAAICPVPGVANQYYIFTNSALFNGVAGTVQFSIVDMAQFGNAAFPSPPTGDVIQKNQAIGGLTGKAEAMIVIPHTNGTDYWLITQDTGTNTFNVTQVSAGGVFNTTSFTGLGFNMAAASFAYHASSNRIAVAPQSSNNDVIILGFDPTLGVLSFGQIVLNTGFVAASNQAIYDVEFSNDGNFLYVSRFGEAGVQADVLQYDILNPGVTLTSVLPQPNSIFRSYGLQMAPDSSIYHLYQATNGGPFLLGSISNVDTVAAFTTYTPQAFAGNLNWNSRQFPSFSPKADVNLAVTFTSEGTCANAPTAFFPTVTPPADSLLWDFGDGAGTSNQYSPVYTYQSGGTFPVTVRAFLNGDSAVFTQNVTITQFDLQIQLVQDTTACTCELPFTKTTSPPTPPPTSCGSFSVTATIQGGSPTQIQWFGPSGLLAGQTTETLTPDSAGYYYIKVFDGSGCFAYAGVNIKEYDVQDQRANIWYFGNMAGIDFNPLPDFPATATSNTVMNAPEGSAIICDRNGQVIIFTDGETVWDRDDNVLATNIGGEQESTMSALIVPVPGDETLYYIFTTQAVDGAGGYQVNYSLFDLKVGLTGTVVEQGVFLYAKSTERVISNGNWVVIHEWGNSNFRAYQITGNGISSPVVSTSGSEHRFSPIANGQGYMKFGAQSRIVTAIPPGTIEVHDFIDSTGVVTNVQQLTGVPAGEVYGVEFSPAGNKVFATVRNGGSTTLVEWAIDTLGNVTGPPINQQNFGEDLGAMQVGPDGQIYVAVNGADYVYSFSANEDFQQITNLTSLQQFPLLAGTNSNLGLPNFTQIISTPIQGPGIAASGFCLGSPTEFSGSGTDNIDEFEWFFGDGAGATGMQATHTYGAAGDYTVSLRITNRCGLDTTLVRNITISPPPSNPNFLPGGGQPVLCNGPLTLEAAAATDPQLPFLTFLWSTGETTRTISVDQQNQYSVVITNTAGCTATGSIIVTEYITGVDLPPNATVCQNAPVFPLNSNYTAGGGFNIQWTINGANAGTAGTQSVNTSVPGVFEYRVTVSDPVVNCSATDSTIVTVNPSPVFTVTPFNTTACGANDGEIQINITGPATSLFTYSVVGPSPAISVIDQPIGLYTTGQVLMPGVYGVSVADQVSGCATITTAPITDNAFTISSVVRQNTCDPLVLTVTHTAVGNFTYRVINATTAQVAATGSGSASPFNTPGVPSGDYFIEMTTTPSNCTATFGPQNFTQDPTVPLVFDVTNICNGTISVETNPAGGSFVWDPSPGLTGSLNSATVTLNTANPGTYNFPVVGTLAGFCPTRDSVTVTFDGVVTPAITQSDACQDQVTLTATPAGNFVYQWSFGGTPFLGGQQIAVTQGGQYDVRLISTATGCSYNATLNAVVVGSFTLSLDATFACEGDPFTITATTNQPATTFTWTFNGTAVPGQSNATLVDTRAGNYAVTASITTSGQTCTASNDIDVVVGERTPGNLNNNAIICNDPANTDPNTNQVVLDPGANFQSYNWFKDQVPLGITTPTLTATEQGLYSVELTNSIGCVSTDETQVSIECLPKITGPNAFRPNGVNSNFFLYSFFIDDADFQVFIFNRWGEMVYQSDERLFKWNGGYNNSLAQPLPPGTYSYVVKYKSSYRPEDGVQEKRGGVVLLR